MLQRASLSSCALPRRACHRTTRKPGRGQSNATTAVASVALLNVSEAAAEAIRVCLSSGLFPGVSPEPCIARLRSGLASGAVASGSDVIALLPETVAQHSPQHPLLPLFVHAEAVRRASQDWLMDSEQGIVGGAAPQPHSASAPAGQAASSNPLAGLSPAAQGDWLLTELREVEGMRAELRNIADKLGSEMLWEVLQDTTRNMAERTELALTTDGSRLRTAGGVFLKLIKPKLAAKTKRSQADQVPDFELRPYQQRAVRRITAEGSNWVVAAPTNTGKTAIFIEAARLLLAQQPSAKVVVLVPTVALTFQQCTAFEKAGFRGALPPLPGEVQDATRPAVDWFCGDKPLKPAHWLQELSRLSVVVLESQSFLNLLDKGAACMQHIHMLVLDECHHTDKEHPYMRVMAHHSAAASQGGPVPQVLGFSASPVNGRTEAEVCLKLQQLLSTLDAQVHVVAEDDQLVQEVGPPPEQEVAHLECRPLDLNLQLWLHDVMFSMANDIEAAVREVLDAPSCSPSARLELEALSVCLPCRDVGPEHAHNLLCSWMRKAFEVARRRHLLRLGTCLMLLELLRRADGLAYDLGYECALQFLAQSCLVLVHRCRSALPRTSGAASNDPDTLDQWLFGNIPPTLPPMTQPHPPDSLPSGSSSPAQREREEDTVAAQLQALRQQVAAAPQPSSLPQPESEEEPLGPCPDIHLDAAQLCRQLIGVLGEWGGAGTSTWTQHRYEDYGEQPVEGGGGRQARGGAQGPGGGAAGEMVAAALAPLMPGGLAPPPSSYPKLWALVSFLRKYRDRPQFHGIVFCSTRQGAHFLAEALRIAATQPPGAQQGIEPLLGFVEEVALLVGHGVGADDKGRRMPSEVLGSGQLYSEGLAGRGMTAQQQQEVLRAFKVPGRRLLVATNAAEEGLDVPCCEFVVRFSPPSTGTQLLQGRGRARKLGSLYHCLLQAPHGGPQLHGGADNKMHKKSLEEEAALRNVLRSMAE